MRPTRIYYLPEFTGATTDSNSCTSAHSDYLNGIERMTVYGNDCRQADYGGYSFGDLGFTSGATSLRELSGSSSDRTWSDAGGYVDKVKSVTEGLIDTLHKVTESPFPGFEKYAKVSMGLSTALKAVDLAIVVESGDDRKIFEKASGFVIGTGLGVLGLAISNPAFAAGMLVYGLADLMIKDGTISNIVYDSSLRLGVPRTDVNRGTLVDISPASSF